MRTIRPLALAAALGAACSGPSATPRDGRDGDGATQVASSATPSGFATATPSEGPVSSGDWIDRSPLVRAIQPTSGVIDFTLQPNGNIVAVVSYGDAARPFQSFHGKDGAFAETPVPWECAASPADLDVQGVDVWVHCADAKSPKDKQTIGFWRSGDGGKTWARAGSLDGFIALGSYALGGGKLFVSGAVDGKKAPLFVVDKGVAKAAKGKVDGFHDAMVRIAASGDGKTIALVAQIGDAPKRELVIAGSTDGGATIHPIWRGPWQGDSAMTDLSVADGKVWIPIEGAGGAIIALAHVALDEPTEPTRQKLPSPAIKACAHGPNVIASSPGGSWQVSRDGGKSFRAIAAPAGQDDKVLECGPDGARLGTQFHCWDCTKDQ